MASFQPNSGGMSNGQETDEFPCAIKAFRSTMMVSKLDAIDENSGICSFSTLSKDLGLEPNARELRAADIASFMHVRSQIFRSICNPSFR